MEFLYISHDKFIYIIFFAFSPSFSPNTGYAAQYERAKSPADLDDYKSSDQDSKDTHADQSNYRIKYKISEGDLIKLFYRLSDEL